MTVYLNLKDRNTGKEYSREINPLVEFFRKSPVKHIEEWIMDRGNEQHSTPSHQADLELISYSVK